MRIKHVNFMIGLPAVLGMLSLIAIPATAQDSKSKEWTPSLTPDGQPDVQGFWLTKEYGMGCLSNPTNGNVGCVRSRVRRVVETLVEAVGSRRKRTAGS